MKVYWQLRNGKIVSDNKMTKMKNRTADLYDGKIKFELQPKVNHILANRIRNMTNNEYTSYFGNVTRKIIK